MISQFMETFGLYSKIHRIPKKIKKKKKKKKAGGGGESNMEKRKNKEKIIKFEE